MNKKKLVKRIVIWTLVAVFCAFALYQGLTVRIYSVSTDKLETDQSLRIVLLTDLHSYVYGKDQSKLITKVKEQKPDLILLAGDMVDKKKSTRGVELLLEGIGDTAPVFYVTGNHEHWSGHLNNIKETIRSYGVTVLVNEVQETEINGIPLVIAGLDDPAKLKYKNQNFETVMEETFQELEETEAFHILLSHRPEKIEAYKKYPFDLVVSGHAHGGQVRIPLLLNGLFAPDQGLFPKYAGGLYQHEGLTHVVSRGLVFNFFRPRVFNPPELVVIDVAGR